MTRRELLALFASSVPLVASACAPRGARSPEERGVPHALEPLSSLLTPVGLRAFVECSPRAIADTTDLIPAVSAIVPEARLDAFRDHNGGIDLRRVDDFVWADYDDTSLVLARTPFDTKRVVDEFEVRSRGTVTKKVHRAQADDGSTFDSTISLEDVVAASASTKDGTSQRASRRALALFGKRGLALEWGPPGPLRAATLFAERRLKKSKPARSVPPLDEAIRRTPLGLVRAFAAGPFEGEWKTGFGGLLAAASAASLVVNVDPKGERMPRLRVGLRVFGAWGDSAASAGTRLRAWSETFALTDLGRLLELEGPARAAELAAEANSLTLEGSFDAASLARGIRSATSAQIDEVVR